MEFEQTVERIATVVDGVGVAGDIIRTVAADLSYRTLGLLTVIIMIWTLLSVELEMKIEGRCPWQSTAKRTERDPPNA